MRLVASLISGATAPSYQFFNDSGLIGSPITSGITAITGTPLFIVPSATRASGATGVYFTCTEGVEAFEDFTERDALDALAGGGGGLDAAGVRAALGMASADLDTQLDALGTELAKVPRTGTTHTHTNTGTSEAATVAIT